MAFSNDAARREAAARSDPRRLRELMNRVSALAEEHEVGSVVVGVAGRDGDPQIPEFMDYVESALRMEDSIFRMTRERSVLFLTDVDPARAEGIVARLIDAFAEQVALLKPPLIELGFAEVPAGPCPPQLRDVMLEAFPTRR
jgi:hypothetical protein